MTKRRMRVDFRAKGEVEVRTLQDENLVAQAFVDQHRAVAEGEPDFYGNPQSYTRQGDWDWFVQYHTDLKENANELG